MIKVGLIGCGDIATYHADGYLAIPEEARVTAVSDVVETKAYALAQQVGCADVFGDFHTLIAEADVDAVDICLPHHLHEDAILAAAAAGKHILCEKPLCLNRQQADNISRAVTESGVILMCAHNQLFDPAVRRTKEMLREGFLGQVYQIHTVDAFRLNTEEVNSLMSWRGKKETMGGGELIDTGYHPTYTLLHLAECEPVEVTAMLSKHRIVAMDGEDSALVLVRFADGVVGSIVSSWAYNLRALTWQFHVIGERGHLYGRKNRLYHKVGDSEPAALEMPAVNTFQAEIADYVSCLCDRRRPMQTEVDGVRVLKVIVSAYRSEEEKRTVDLTGDGW